MKLHRVVVAVKDTYENVLHYMNSYTLPPKSLHTLSSVWGKTTLDTYISIR